MRFTSIAPFVCRELTIIHSVGGRLKKTRNAIIVEYSQGDFGITQITVGDGSKHLKTIETGDIVAIIESQEKMEFSEYERRYYSEKKKTVEDHG